MDDFVSSSFDSDDLVSDCFDDLDEFEDFAESSDFDEFDEFDESDDFDELSDESDDESVKDDLPLLPFNFFWEFLFFSSKQSGVDFGTEFSFPTGSHRDFFLSEGALSWLKFIT